MCEVPQCPVLGGEQCFYLLLSRFVLRCGLSSRQQWGWLASAQLRASFVQDDRRGQVLNRELQIIFMSFF